MAQWEAITTAEPEPEVTYTVTFDSNGGTAVASQTVTDGDTATKPNDPTREGYYFDGWYLDSAIYDFDTIVSGDITLVAQWTEVTEMLIAVEIATDDVKKEYVIGDEFDGANIVISATFRIKASGNEYTTGIELTDENVTVDYSAFDSSAAGTYTIYVGYTFDAITYWDNYEVTVSSVISGVHGIELVKEVTEYNVAIDEEATQIDISDVKVYSVNENGELGEEITTGITYKYFLGDQEINAEDMTNLNVRTFQIWVYVDYTEGNETYTMSDFVLVEIIGNVIDSLTFYSGTNSQEQSYTDSMSSTWVIMADYSLTGIDYIDLSQATIGTGVGQYTISGITPAVVGGGTAIVTYYYALGDEVASAECQVPYAILNATTSGSFSAVIDFDAGTSDAVELPDGATVITSVADGDEMVAYMVVSNGLSGITSENRSGYEGGGQLSGRAQFGESRGVTLYMAGPATITLYARYGSSSGSGSTYVLYDSLGNLVYESAMITQTSMYEIVTITVPYAGVYTLFTSTGSLNTFRIEIEGTIVPAQITFDVNSYEGTDFTTDTELDGTFTVMSSNNVTLADNSAAPVTVGGIEFVQGINLGGSKRADSTNARSIKFEITDEMLSEGYVILTVYANHGGSSGAENARHLGLYADGYGSSNYIMSADVDASGSVVHYVITDAGTYYMGSQNSGINIYRIIISYGGA